MPLVRPKQRYGRNKTLSDAIYSRLGDCMQEEENEDSLAKAGEQIDWLAKTVIRDQQYNGPKVAHVHNRAATDKRFGLI